MAESEYIDIESGIKRVVNNRQLYIKLLNNCKLQEMYNELLDSVNNKDNENAKHIAHTLKGIAANLSLTAVSDIVVDMDMKLKVGEDVIYMLEPLQRAIEGTIEAIANLTSA